MKIRHILLFSLIFTINIFSGYCVQVSGFIRENNSEESLIGTNIFCKQQKIGVSSDNRGYFSLALSMPCIITVSYAGYLTQDIPLNMSKDSLLLVKMITDNNLAEITVTATNIPRFDVTRITSKELTLIPTIGGKPDIIKALQLLPGVQTQSEGMSLMLVRGGEPGQNQYLLDNVPLIYVNHFGGMFSVFNPDMINSVDFYKGNFPARQGGKLSSIVDITQREGDKSKHQGSFSLGVTDASFTFEGPLSKKASYIVTARKTLIDAFLAGFSAIDNAATYNQIIAYGFHDINAKISYHPDEKNSLSFNLYQGDDYFNLWKKPWVKPKNEPFHIYQQWGNLLVSGRWNCNINPMLYTENIVSFSRYRNKSGNSFQFLNSDTVTNSSESVQMASVNDLTFRTATKYNIFNNWNLEFGGQIGYSFFEPFYNTQTIDNKNTIKTGQVYHTIESALFIDNKINLTEHFILQPSFRLSHYYNNTENFLSPEPRINLTYLFNKNQRINVNYMRVNQSSHLIFTPSYLLKSEVWLPSNGTLPPEIANQLALSWNGNFGSGKYTTEAGIYHKQMKNMVTLKEGYENMLELSGVENKIESNGKGTAYGFECMIRKNSGKWTGSIAYSWSYANRQFDNINLGIPYEFDYNRAHNFTFNVYRELKNNWNMNIVWLFQTGTPFTPALGKVYTYNPETKTNDVELIYGTKNSARMPPYHRLDIGFNHTITTKRGYKAVWTYSVYNAYNNINPYTNYYDDDNDVRTFPQYMKPLKQFKYGFFTFIPSIAYKVYFDYSKKPISTDIKEKKAKKKFNWLYF